ncbi:MAG: hypothetical protein ACLR67_00200 [Eggerthella lenta]
MLEGYAFPTTPKYAWRQHPERETITLEDMEQAVVLARKRHVPHGARADGEQLE